MNAKDAKFQMAQQNLFGEIKLPKLSEKWEEYFSEHGGKTKRFTCHECGAIERMEVPFDFDSDEIKAAFVVDFRERKKNFWDVVHDKCYKNRTNSEYLAQRILPLVRKWLADVKYKSFHDGTVTRVTENLNPFDLFITDVLNCQLSLCMKLNKNRDDCETWADNIYQFGPVVMNCRESYNSPINGPFKVPSEEWLNENYGDKNEQAIS